MTIKVVRVKVSAETPFYLIGGVLGKLDGEHWGIPLRMEELSPDRAQGLIDLGDVRARRFGRDILLNSFPIRGSGWTRSLTSSYDKSIGLDLTALDWIRDHSSYIGDHEWKLVSEYYIEEIESARSDSVRLTALLKSYRNWQDDGANIHFSSNNFASFLVAYLRAYRPATASEAVLRTANLAAAELYRLHKKHPVELIHAQNQALVALLEKHRMLSETFDCLSFSKLFIETRLYERNVDSYGNFGKLLVDCFQQVAYQRREIATLGDLSGGARYLASNHPEVRDLFREYFSGLLLGGGASSQSLPRQLSTFFEQLGE